ncbi:OLC1v1022633C1 [Oldenlandia corymbosa var. corymbosa]|uniref:peptidylprolyl isomerase n=1 Tax=Oldenlandia corymbosa var. corymbosa TaxID=529605 RepID=A0AAV1BZU8_OLDCO|nr:OLC1v1022633C1 [Oldenlandia corymbosa var. corymbosa]
MALCSSAATPAFLKFKAAYTLLYPTHSSFSSLVSLPRNFLLLPIRTTAIFSTTCIKHLSINNSPPPARKFVTSAFTSEAEAADATLEKLPADLKVTETQEPNSRVRLSVEVPPEVCEDCHNRIIQEFMKRAKVPGFRPGHNVPESILVNYIGKQNIQKAIIESILKRTLPHAMSSIAGKALDDSLRIVTKFSEMEKTYSSSNSLRYDVVVDVAPELKWIPEGGYKNLKIVVQIDSEITAQIASEEELKRRHKSLGALKIVTERGLQLGDVAILDISATTFEEDKSAAKKIPSAESKGFQFDTEDADKILPGFLESIVGMQREESRTFPYVFPETWAQEDLRGVRANFTVECKELFYRDLPELNDSIANKLLPGCKTLDEVKESLLQKCLEVEQTAKEQAADNAILDRISKMIEVDIPRSLFEEQGRQLYGAQLLQLQANSKLSEKQLAYLSSPKAVNEFLETNKENIHHIIKQNLAVGDIFKRENLQFSTDELVKEVQNSISEFKKHNQEYDEDRVKEQVQEVLEGAKVLEWLREHAEIEYKTQ